MKQYIKYCFVGASGVIVNLVITYCLTEFLHVFYLLSALIGISVSMTSNFLLNKNWTFSEQKQEKISRQE